ncbi:type III secretion system export apparatus subunit SctV [Aquabacterium sp. A7-Y]|uniref:type III secretion system export apparatus subunit SctV n=1 Tax=Aquabacterium sp. A7-Y TaxID=1349605 RepID=UPI00223DD4DF|nr:type III secretion system export apparatus subunit SctV [Aquabacterium sp. A7-Y]MCW7536978.1 type III secretion system export apparatus subunit SctV [Aquabacterium sp. A7-Y]
MNELVLKINAWAAQAARRAELVAAAVVIAIVFMLVLPMPIWLLDVLIAVNLCASGLIVVVSMYMPGPTAFSTFPSVLLLTTLFRLAIEVSTTRLILLEGDAGHIVETFGNFVVGGNIVVGLVIFLILTVVQFIVITKGSERVSEVTARFSLDAMPGKQMSIDSDLRAGLLTPDQAKKKRAELAMESQLHGAMDGAMKFVKGDAIAGIFIVVINLLGGVMIGVVQRGMTAGDAMQLYSILSIGDALIAQIPALLISLSAGMITTRVGGEDESAHGGAAPEPPNVGQQIVRELFHEPKALLTAAAIMLLFALIPGMPTLVFLLLALLLGAGGAVGLLSPRAEAERAQAEDAASARKPQLVDAQGFQITKTFMVVFHESVRGTPEAEAVILAIRQMRNGMVQGVGLPQFPVIEFTYDSSVPPDQMQFLLVEVPLVTTRLRVGWGSTTETPERLQELGLEAQVEELAGSRRKRVWLRLDDPRKLQEAGIAYERWENVLASDIEVELLRNCQMFLGVQEVQRFLRWAEATVPELAKELVRVVAATRVADVMQRLARERISLRNIRLILESIYEWGQKERDPDLVADYVRLSLKRQLCHQVARQGLIQAVLLSPELEDMIRSSIRRSSMGTYVELDQEVEQTLLDKLAEFGGHWGTQRQAPVLVTTADIRRQVRRLIEEEFFAMPVFGFTELSQHYRVQPIGVIEI